MSRPKASVPKKYLSLPPIIQAGGRSLSRRVWSIGEWGASRGAKTAMMTITEMMTIGTQGTRAVRRGAASRRGHTMARHKDQRLCSTVGRSAIAISGALRICLPRQTGEVPPQGAEGEGLKDDAESFRSEISAHLDWGFPPPALRAASPVRRERQMSGRRYHHANLILGSTYA